MTRSAVDSRTRVVAFVFTDIEGSSRLWEQEPERMQLALTRHDAIVRAAVEQNRGTVIKMVGDGIHAAFEDPFDALLATLAMQQALADPAATSGIAFHIRCGVHAGAVERRDNDFFGTAVNRAARIMAAAHGGQVLVSQAVAALVGDRSPAGATLRELGKVRLRDLANAEQVFQLVHPELRQDFPPLRSLESTPNNLPQQVTSFIGRTHELAEVKRLLAQSRVLTLLGTGGIGKTRLSLQLAADVLDAYQDGVWCVDLAPITEPALVADALAHVLGLREEAGAPLTETICRHIRSQQMLLLIDNCEHLLTACATLVDALIRAGPAIRILATSREPLRTAGEQVYPLPALALPDPKADLATLLRCDAVRLFVERARLRQPEFTIGEREAPAVASICTRLDGIPLALELAAARVGTLSVERIAARLDDRFGLLTRGPRTALPRQQALRALIDWSHDLLEPVEKVLFARLSVFAAGWSLAAAEAVASGESLPQEQILDGLDRLVAKSLVLTNEGEDRYTMLETIREYARGRLQATGAEETLRARHHAHFLALAEEAEPFLRSRTEEALWLRRLEKEHDNFKAALQWSLAPGRNTEKAVRLCAALGHFWNVRGHWREGRDWYSAAIRQDDGKTPKDVCARALLSASILSFMLGDYAEAEVWLQEARVLARETGNRDVEAGALNNLSNIVLDRGDLAQAMTLLEQAVAINRELGNHAWETINLGNLGSLLISRGDFSAARVHLEQALALSRKHGSPSGEAYALSMLGLLEQRRGDYRAARELAGQSLALYRELEAPAQEVEQLQLLADASVASGDLPAAARYFEEVLRTGRELGYRNSIARCFEGMVALAVKAAAWPAAARFIGVAEALRELTGVVATPSEIEQLLPCCTECRSALGELAYATAAGAGRGQSPEAATSDALAWLATVA